MARRRAAVLLACVYSPIVPSTRIGTPSRRGLQVFGIKSSGEVA